METNSNSKSIITWISFIVIIGLIVWGLIAADQKAKKEQANLVLPDQIVATDHIRGEEKAPVTLIEYGDFQCPACGAYYPIVEQTVNSMATGTLRYVFRNFPLPMHPNAIPAATAAEAANKQGKFWEMYHILYEKQEEWTGLADPKSAFISYAKGLGLDEQKFTEDYGSKEIQDKITNDYKGGAKAGIAGTPTFFVNGKKIESPQNYDEFKKLLEESLPKINL